MAFRTDRRTFLAQLSCLLAGPSGKLWSEAKRVLPSTENLIPRQLATAPNYWCTWSAQNYMYGQGLAELDAGLLEGQPGANLAEKQISESALFGPGGWLDSFHPKVRKELYVLLDEGWEQGGYATFLPDEKKFPSLRGSPPERLKQLNMLVQAHGWRALALWCRDTPGGTKDATLVEWSKEAGIPYWKIDGGDKNFNVDRVRDELRSSLITEHVFPEGPLNGDWRKDGRFGLQAWDSPRIAMLRHSDVYRTYDTSTTLSIATTLDRISELLRVTKGHSAVRALLNCEDEVYLAAAIGCAMGIMRHPMTGKRPHGDPDIAFAGPRQTKRRMDEVARAVRWQRVAAPYPVSAGFTRIDDEILTDEWLFEKGQTWYTESIGVVTRQGAPARLARNLELPEVKTQGDKPFTVTGRFPNGSAAICTQARTRRDKGWFLPEADVLWHIADAPGPFGVFGQFRSLTLVSNKTFARPKVLAQDLAGDRAFDISSQVTVRGKEMTVPGELLRRLGLEAATPGDLSDPGLMLAVRPR